MIPEEWVAVIYTDGDDDTPLDTDNGFFFSGFTGIRL